MPGCFVKSDVEPCAHNLADRLPATAILDACKFQHDAAVNAPCNYAREHNQSLL